MDEEEESVYVERVGAVGFPYNKTEILPCN
jgi:hypothetical protein